MDALAADGPTPVYRSLLPPAQPVRANKRAALLAPDGSRGESGPARGYLPPWT